MRYHGSQNHPLNRRENHNFMRYNLGERSIIRDGCDPDMLAGDVGGPIPDIFRDTITFLELIQNPRNI